MIEKRIIKLIGITAVIFSAQTNGDNINQQQPYHIETFKIPESLKDDFKDYRKNFTRLTSFEHSGLHWQQFIVVYAKQQDNAYKHNYLQYIAWHEDPDDEDNEPSYVTYPVGTIIIKENISSKEGKPDKALTITAMIKREHGFSPKYGDWQYIQFDTQGTILLEGPLENEQVYKNCASCHINVSDRDYIFSHAYSASRN